MNDINDWPSSIIDRILIVSEVGRFLRTHRSGYRLLMDWLASVPIDRTEGEYAQERHEATGRHRAATHAALAEHNIARAAQGLPPVDRYGDPIPDTGGSVQ